MRDIDQELTPGGFEILEFCHIADDDPCLLRQGIDVDFVNLCGSAEMQGEAEPFLCLCNRFLDRLFQLNFTEQLGKRSISRIKGNLQRCPGAGMGTGHRAVAADAHHAQRQDLEKIL